MDQTRFTPNENRFGSIRYNSIGSWLRKEFGGQVSKLSLSAGFTCPNRDGSLGTGGCIFCSEDGSGAFAGDIQQQIVLLSKKWPLSKHIAYFQSYTNTYASAEILRQKYEQALAHDHVVGLAIATRPDCLPDEVLDLLSELNNRTFLWVELGLQSMHEKTGNFINRCYPTRVFDEAMDRLHARGIRTVVHLIFGLPGENREDMLETVNYVGEKKPFGIKIHQLFITKDSPISRMDFSLRIPGCHDVSKGIMEKEEYIGIVVDALERLPQSITIHRLTGDPPKDTLIAPLWCRDKKSVLNGIQMELKRRGSFQGSLCHSPKRPSL